MIGENVCKASQRRDSGADEKLFLPQMALQSLVM